MGIILTASFCKEHEKFKNLSGLLVNVIYLPLLFAHLSISILRPQFKYFLRLSISILRPQFSDLLPVSGFMKLKPSGTFQKWLLTQLEL